MDHLALNNHVQKSRIAVRTFVINVILLLLVLVLIMAMAAVMVRGITNDASKNFARLYSAETVEEFNSFIKQDLVLVRMVARSKAVTEWFTDENNLSKKAVACDVMMNYADMLQSPFLYFVVNGTLNEYSVSGRAAPEKFVPFDRLEPSVPYNHWYFDCINSKDDYTLNIDIDKVTNTTRLWINHKVMNGKDIAGVFCSGLPFDEVNHSLFSRYDSINVKGYIIDKNGFVKMDSSLSDRYFDETESTIPEAASNPALASAIETYLKNIDGYFGANAQPEVINLGNGTYNFASIAPLEGSDWSVVTFFSSNSLFSVRNLLPLVIVMLSAFLLYALAVNAMIQRFLLVPINLLTKSVSEAESGTANFFGHNRNDEIGILAKTIQSSAIERQHLEHLLNTVNSTTAVLLMPIDEDDFEASLLEGMDLIGLCVDIDWVNIWRNETIDGELHFVLQHDWFNGPNQQRVPVQGKLRFPYSSVPGWKEKFSKGEYIKGPVSGLPQSDQIFLKPFGIKSTLIIPVHLEEELWGFVCFDDAHKERTFTDEEVNILRSGSLMMVSAINRNIQAVQLREAKENTQVLLDAMPLACELWNRDGTIFDCNEKAVELFKAKDKQDYINNFFDFSAKYQSGGQLSTEAGMKYINKAFEEGRSDFEWLRQTSDSTPVPTVVTLVRVKFGDEYVLAGYARDLREHKQMMKEIEQRDRLLNTVNSAATVLLQAELGEFAGNLYSCMGMLASAIEADRVYIWKNHTKNGRLYCTQLFEWSEGAEPQQGNEFTVDISYSDELPQWEETLSRGNCINGLTHSMPAPMQTQLLLQGILSILIVPVIVRNEFWGFVGYDNCHSERIFTKNEESILRSASMLMASSWLRRDITLNIHATAAKLEAVIVNYPGIIWCVDKDNIITLFNGRYLNELDFEPSFFEGKIYDDALQDERFQGIRTSVQKTFAGGTQDANFEIGGRMYRIRTTPIYDDSGNLTNVIGNFDDITERTRLQAELKAALTVAQEASNAKSDFLANMSHEMRTPLNAIIGLSELTLGSEGLDGESLSNLEKINNAGTTLLSMVNDILDISKIESGKFILVPAEYYMSSLLNDTITQSILHIGEKPIEFRLDIDKNLPIRLYGDDLRIKQILNNLLSNAFKYTREGIVEMGVSSEREDSVVWLTIRVSDSGIGIRSDDLGNLFKDYVQMDIRTNHRIEGTGLGLPITKSIVEMMDGSISVESEYGKGSVFTVRLRQGFVTDDVIGEEEVSSLKSFRYSEQKRRKNSRMIRIRLPYARVLVVDDVVTNLDVARGMMKPYGMRIDCVTSGQEAIDAIRNEKVKYNAVFMDHMMPGMDGIEAVRFIREEIGTEYAKTIPIIALTANAKVGNEEMFLRNGFQAFISKPIEIEHLDAVIREWVRDKKQEKILEQINVDGKMLPDIRGGTDRRIFFDRRSRIGQRTCGKISNWIDMEKGIERLGGDKDSYLQVLRSYAVNTRPLLELVRGVNRDNLSDYAITVHGIKGSSRGICVNFIGDRAEALEKAAKEGNYDFVITNNTAFAEELEKILGCLDDLLRQMTSGTSKPKKDMPDREILSRLSIACDAYDMDGVDAAMTEVESFEYESDNGLAAWLRENVDLLNFTQIKERLSALPG